jgi:cytochrome c biogenesis protein CcmG/thiol:disulfide interchange protein DsbE
MTPGWVVAMFAALVLLLGVGLTLNPREVPSPLVGKPAPAFELPRLHAPEKTFSREEMLGKVWVMNVWASWCPPCLVEHPVVSALAKGGLAPVVGLNYKDRREDALAWLKRNGDPYEVTAQDADGRIGIDYGEHVPSLPASAHEPHMSVQSVSQQNPSTQWPVAHSALLVQATPASSSARSSPGSRPKMLVQPAHSTTAQAIRAAL